MIFSLVSITSGSSLLACGCFSRRVDSGIFVLEKSVIPIAKLVIMTPMSLNERSTPSSSVAFSCWSLVAIMELKHSASDGLAALSNMCIRVRVSSNRSLKL